MTATPEPPSAWEIVQAGAASPNKTTQRLAARVEDLLTQLFVTVQVETAAAEVADLEARLEAARAKLAEARSSTSDEGPTPELTTPALVTAMVEQVRRDLKVHAPDGFQCTDCDRRFASPSGMSIHRGKAHRSSAAQEEPAESVEPAENIPADIPAAVDLTKSETEVVQPEPELWDEVRARAADGEPLGDVLVPLESGPMEVLGLTSEPPAGASICTCGHPARRHDEVGCVISGCDCTVDPTAVA